MVRRFGNALLVAAMLMARTAQAQDFVFGVHNGDTQTRQLTRSGYTTFEQGSTRGLAGAIRMKPWLAFSLELLLVDKGVLSSRAKPHRYFEVPYMARIASPWQFRNVRPFVAVGAAYAYELTCDQECASSDRVTTDFSRVHAWGATYTWNRLEVALEQRRTRGQNSVNRRPDRYATNDMRSLLLRLSLVIPGIVPDWM